MWSRDIFFARAGLVDFQRAPVEFYAVEGSDSCLSFVLVGHSHKTEAARSSCELVYDDLDFFDDSVGSKEGVDLSLSCLVGEVTDVYLHTMSLVGCSRNEDFGQSVAAGSAKNCRLMLLHQEGIKSYARNRAFVGLIGGFKWVQQRSHSFFASLFRADAYGIFNGGDKNFAVTNFACLGVFEDSLDD